MKIEKIEKLRSGKYKLTTDNKDKIITYDDVILKNNLLYQKDLNYDLLEQLNSDTIYFDIYNKCIKMIIKKLRSEQEINTFLEKYSLSVEDNNKIINDLKENNFINDKNYAKAYIADRFNLSSDGLDKIRHELLKQNIDNCLIDEEINKIDEEDIINKLTKLIIKKINSSTTQSNYQLKQKLLANFINLGYEKNLILEIINSNLKQNTIAIKREYDKLVNRHSKKYQGEKLEYFIKQKLYQKGYTGDEISKLDN